MALRGAKVMGIDSVARNIEIADQHARANGLSVTYRHQTVEALAETGQTYDVVLALEVVEHVLDLPLFLASTAKLVRPGGVLILSTLNRTFKSYCLAIVGAEYILRWLPRGTHQWRKFVPPSFLIGAMESQGFELRDSIGVAMNPFTRRFRRTPSLAVNYTLVFVESAREQSV
jgi:2-polyprenyl-6-hydroxyphenyl methylase/3-demethylubiquinone-9 3-methyltransferase